MAISFKPRSALKGKTVGEFEHEFDVSIVLHRRKSAVDLHPHSDTVLEAGDSLAIFAEPQTLATIARLNR